MLWQQRGVSSHADRFTELFEVEQYLAHALSSGLKFTPVWERPLAVVGHCETLSRIWSECRRPTLLCGNWKIREREVKHLLLDCKRSTHRPLNEVNEHRNPLLWCQWCAPHIANFRAHRTRHTCTRPVLLGRLNDAPALRRPAFLLDNRRIPELLKYRLKLPENVFKLALFHADTIRPGTGNWHANGRRVALSHSKRESQVIDVPHFAAIRLPGVVLLGEGFAGLDGCAASRESGW